MARFTRLLIIINVAVFALEAVSGSGLLANFALWPVGHFVVAQFDRPGRIQAVAADHVRLSSCEFPSSGDQHVRALDVWL